MKTKFLTIFGSLCITVTMQANINCGYVSTDEKSPITNIELSSDNGICTTPQTDETIDNTKELKALVQRVDSLEHELSFLKLSYDMNKLNSDLNMFINELNNTSNDLKLSIYTRNCDYDVYEAYKKNYESVLDKMAAFERLIESSKFNFELRILKYPYSENEMKLLKASYNIIDYSYTSLKAAKDLYKVALETYRDAL